MGKPPQTILSSTEDGPGWRVVDDLQDDYPVGKAELDAIEAFLMPFVSALLADDGSIVARRPSLASPPAAIHKQASRSGLKDG